MRPIARRAAILAAALLAALALGEAGLRLAGFDPVRDIARGRDFVLRPSSTPGMVYELTPLARGTLWDAHVSINSHGFRDREYELRKPPGATRVVALGDSITFGNSLPQGSTWPDRLEELYVGDGRRVEVLNLGVGGYDTWQELAFLERTGLAFAPDYVLLCYCVNDLAVVSVNLGTILGLERFRGWMGRSRIAQWVSLSLDRRDLSEELRALRARERRELRALTIPPDDRLGMLRAELEDFLATRSKPGKEQLTEKVGWDHLELYLEAPRLERVRRGFERLAELSRRQGFRPLLFVHPYLEHGQADWMAPAWDAVYAMVEHQARAAGLEVVDVRGALQAEGLARLRHEQGNAIHPGVEGHDVLARALRAALAALPGLE